MPKNLPLLPFCVMATAMLLFYTNFINYFDLPSLVFPLLKSLALVGIVLCVIWLLVRNATLASVICTVIVFAWCSYSNVYQSFANVQRLIVYYSCGSYAVPISGPGFFAGWLVFVCLLIYLCYKHQRFIGEKYGLFTTIAVCCLLVTTADLSIREFTRRQNIIQVRDSIQGPLKAVKLNSHEGRPDIYYIILDGCARSDILKSMYHYDNSQFIAQLKQRGFYVPSHSCSNYQMTALSLGSSMNMTYISDAERFLPRQSNDWLPMLSLIKDNLVAEKLKQLGYKYVVFDTDWSNTRSSPIADEIIYASWHDDFLHWFADTTFWPLIEGQLHVMQNLAYLNWLETFEKTSNLGRIVSPKFVFVHFLLPHAPYLFNADGSPSQCDYHAFRFEDFGNKIGYVEQLKFTEHKVIELIDRLLAQGKGKPIIILQADHGPASLDFNLDTTKPSKAFLNERLSIFNAYYFPNANYSRLYDSISPVNSFRVVFDTFFDAKLNPLADRSYFSNYVDLYKFEDVTSQLNHSATSVFIKDLAAIKPTK